MKAAVFHGAHERLTIEQVDIDTPIEHEVVVRVVASGVCHSDLHFVDGYYEFPAPAILGHEAAGIVEAVGPMVDEFAPGDHVIGCLSVFCGHCEYCLTGRTHLCSKRPTRRADAPPKLRWQGEPVNQFANLSAYAERMLVHSNAPHRDGRHQRCLPRAEGGRGGASAHRVRSIGRGIDTRRLFVARLRNA
jgi:S-(hydroxymethyl)glutathione dehydrogenase/alcohol dehydrogenase